MIKHKWVVRCECGVKTGLPGPGEERYLDDKGMVIETDTCISCGAVIRTRDGYWIDGQVADPQEVEEDLLAVD